MKTLKELKISIFVLTLSLFFQTSCVSNQATLPPAAANDMPSIVFINKSEQAYIVYMAIPEEKEQEVRSKFAGKKDVFLMKWSEFSLKKDKHLSANILKNEYQDSRVVEGMFQLLERAPGVPFGLTWNGGVAYTYNDYQHAKKTYKKYTTDPDDYERTRVRDPRADPVKPEWHFGPLLGW